MARLDAELVARGIARSRERAKEMISAGAVTVNGRAAVKASAQVSEEDEILSAEQELYVGRGALKLEGAAKAFGLDFTGRTCLDIGASTGGFTEYLLIHGAARVFAVDVGHGQLAESLRRDDRVVNMEGTDIRQVTVEDLGGQADFVCGDVSFISLALIVPKLTELLREGCSAALLIKPQFEAGKRDIGKGGIVKDRKVHIRVLEELDGSFRALGLSPVSYAYSPVKGGSGNIEYLVHLIKGGPQAPVTDMVRLVEEAFSRL
ncbi:MAG: TlyA family RNA methyltransferase [Ruminococcus sp.]|nr:TlyA family RNA methyltransferase [Ruminococcus sp.]